MKKLYVFFALAGLLAIHQTNTMLTRGVGRVAPSVLSRTGLTAPSVLGQAGIKTGQTLGLGARRGLVTGTRFSGMPKPEPGMFGRLSTWRPQIQMPQVLQNYRQNLSNQLNQLAYAARTNPYLQSLLVGLGLGYGITQQPVLAEESMSPEDKKYLDNEYTKLIKKHPHRRKRSDLFDKVALSILIPGARNENIIEEREDDAYIHLFKKALQEGYEPNISLVNTIYAQQPAALTHKRLLSLIEKNIINPNKLLSGPITQDYKLPSPEIREILIALAKKDPNIFTQSDFINTTKEKIQSLRDNINNLKEEIKGRLDVFTKEERDDIESLKEEINFQNAILHIIAPPSLSNLGGFWR